MSPWKWRLTGFGTSIGCLAIVGGVWVSPLTDNNAEASVCFTTPAGCYCVDFFLTEAKEMVINKAQEAVQKKIKEQEFFKNYGLLSIVEGAGLNEWLEESPDTEAYRQWLSGDMRDREALYRGYEDPNDTEGETRKGRETAVINRVSDHPDDLVPYSGESRSGSERLSKASVWTDQILLPTDDLTIPSDAQLKEMRTNDLYHLYDRARNTIKTNYARAYMQEMAIQQEKLDALASAREKLDRDLMVDGAVDAGTVHAAMIQTATEIEMTESWARKEGMLALLLSTRLEKGGLPQ